MVYWLARDPFKVGDGVRFSVGVRLWEGIARMVVFLKRLRQ